MKDNRNDIQAQFGKSAKKYVTSNIHAKGKDLQKLVEIAQLTGTESVLDVATGGGHVANALAPHSNKVIAFDLTNEILKAAKDFIQSNHYENVEFLQGDAQQMPFSVEQFDVVTCRIAAHHFPQPLRFVEESYRVLKPNGTLLFIDNVAPERDDFDTFYNKVEKERDYSHHRAWKKSEWFRMLEECGFEVEEMYRFPKTFIYEEWCQMMNLSVEKKDALSTYIMNQQQEYREKFRIKVENGQLLTFSGESILLKARKPMK